MFDDRSPIYQQIAERIKEDILRGAGRRQGKKSLAGGYIVAPARLRLRTATPATPATVATVVTERRSRSPRA